MKRILILTCLMLVGPGGCEDDAPTPVIKKKKEKAGEEADEPEYIDHAPGAVGQNSGYSQFPQANGKVPLTQNPGVPQGNVPPALNPTPPPDPNVPQNISRLWDGQDFYSNANVDVKPLVP